MDLSEVRKTLTRDQQHFCVKPKSVDEYISRQDESVQPRLQAIRETICTTIPDAQEKVLPTFWKEQNIIHFASFKKHIGLYPGWEVAEVFEERLTEFDIREGTIRRPITRSSRLR